MAEDKQDVFRRPHMKYCLAISAPRRGALSFAISLGDAEKWHLKSSLLNWKFPLFLKAREQYRNF